MRSSCYSHALKKAVLVLTILLAAASASFAQSVALTATPQTTTLPDGNSVPMWGWVCGAVSGATCTAMNGVPQLGGTIWQPPLITVPSGGTLSITLNNSLPAGVAGTSLTIVGQLGTGTGSKGVGDPTRESAARTDGAHGGQTMTTWTSQTPAQFLPPAQGARARSFAQEAGPGSSVTYNWASLKQGTYLIETGTYPSIQGPMGLYGVLVVTTAPVAVGTFVPGTAYTGTTSLGPYSIQYDADAPLLLSEIDPAQNAAVAAAVTTSGFSETMKWSAACGIAPVGNNTCYPAAVNFTPMYFMINGTSFDPTVGGSSAAPVLTSYTTGNVLLRFVNAGLRMHVPSVSGLSMSLIAEDGSVLPDVALAASQSNPLTVRVQNDVFLSAGKVYDVMVSPAATLANPPTVPASVYNNAGYQIFDRELSLSSGGTRHDSGMQTTLLVGGALGTPSSASAKANPDNYFVAPTVTLNVSDPGKGVVANDVYVSGVKLLTGTGPLHGVLTLNPNGTFTYVPDSTWTSGATSSDSFQYYANNSPTNPNLVATVTLTLSSTSGLAPFALASTFNSNVASMLKVSAPGVLQNDTDPSNYPLHAAFPPATAYTYATPPVTNANGSSVATMIDGTTVTLMPDGSFTVVRNGCGSACGAATIAFPHVAINSENVSSLPAGATGGPDGQIGIASLTFQQPSKLTVLVQDAGTQIPITDYKWIIEQDLSFKLDPSLQVNNGTIPPTLGTNFHTSYYPVIATGCTGDQSCERGQTVYDNDPNSPTYQQHVAAVCEGTGICVPTSQAGTAQQPPTMPGDVYLPPLDATGRPASYYISILPGDAGNAAFNGGTTAGPVTAGFPTGSTVTTTGHTMSGAPIPNSQIANGTITVNVQPNPLVPATVTAYVFEDDWPLNGEPDAGGGVDTLATQEVPLDDFQIIIWDSAGYSGDATGQMTYDMFNEPLTNALNGTIDPATGLDACPISNSAGQSAGSTTIVGVIIVCPRFESDGKTPSPITGQVVVRNLMPGRFGITAHPGAQREARGEEWLQTNTLDGTHFLDAFIRAGEPAYFQEFGPGGYHVFFGEANPAIINARLNKDICIGTVAPTCNNTVSGQVTNLHMARPTNEYLSDSNVGPAGDPMNYTALAHTTCYVSLGDPDGETFAFTKCDQNGNFSFTGIPDGDWALVAFDQWLDLIVDGTSKSVSVHGGQTVNLDFPAFTWQTHIWSNTFMDLNGDGIRDIDPNTGLLEPGLLQIPTRIRMRNGKINNTLLSDITGAANFNETFPLFNWYVVESDTTRFKGTGVHVVYDSGGTVDGPNSPYRGILNSTETNPLPTNLRVPGAYYCGKADCSDIPFTSVSGHPVGGPGGSTGRVDPGNVITEGLQGFLSQTQILEWGKTPYQVGETGGIRGHVVYSSTRPFDDVSQQFQNLWEPLIPNVTVNLYREGTGPDGTISLQLIDTTTTSSWDAWAQGARVDPASGTPIVDPGTGMNIPNMSCPGQDPLDPFLPYTLSGTTNFLYPNIQRPDNSQFKCYDSLRVFNQVQPAPYDGIYLFPTPNCGHCDIGNVLQSDGTYTHPVSLIAGKYVVEVVPPPGYELVKEEDKNILIGDAYIAPATQQFGAMSNIFIMPDQATINNANPAYLGIQSATGYTGQNGGAINPTTDLGHTLPSTFGPGGAIVQTAPCVGALRIVPDYMSISPESGQVAPFAGASRHLCNRKEVTLEDQSQAQTDFFLWTKTPAASHFTGFILDDMSSEFDPASPAFGEKFAVPNLPISIKDFNGNEVSRIYSDQWGIFNGMSYSTWDVNPPNPTGYAPNMMVTCMNDPGPIPDPSDPTHTRMITDPMYNPQYSNFCYENPFMPADTSYLDTPVVPTTAFAEGYNPPDCNYPDATPAVSEVDGDGIGPWVSAAGQSLTINALGDQSVPNHAYSGPAASTPPYNQKVVTRHYGFGSTQGTVTIGGIDVSASVTGWSDSTISLTIPQSLIDALPVCASSYSQGLDGATDAATAAANAVARFGKCGQLIITAANGKQSVDAVTVTIGGFNGPVGSGAPTPAYVVPGTSIQSVIDAAYPGDIIMVPPGTYTEMLLLWKPVRLQGVGAASVTVNANTHPSGVLLEPWRRKVDCLFGLALSGGLIGSTPKNPPGAQPLVYDPSNTFSCDASSMQGQIDPVPQEAVIGWDASINGNLAELLQEPSLMGAYEGAAITVLGKGVHSNNTCGGTEQPNCIPLTTSATDCAFQSNFLCAPARIDGMTFTNSSQGGGGVFLHGWTHYAEVSNNRIHGNGGTLSGGIIVGQPEAAEATFTNGIADPYGWDTHVNIHNNAVTSNVSYGDELNSTTPASAGGVVLCLGSDYYKFNYNWVCGNFSTGDGGGLSHYGYSVGGHIEHNSFLFNQSYNTTITTHGGGVIIQGGPPDGAVCEAATVDKDCPPGLTDGAGSGLVVNANLIMGNTAESGSGGGLRLQNINGADVFNNRTDPTKWNRITITNNIIANNVAGWIGGGVSLYDAVNVDFINNTVVSNDDTASAGVLFDTLGAPNSNQPPPGCDPTLVPPPPACTNTAVTTSNFQPAGLASEHHSPILTAAFSADAATNAADCATLSRPNCDKFSNPLLVNNVIWQNRAFHITTNPSSPAQGLQTVVTLTPQLNQVNNNVGVTGSCPSGATYWDIGVYGDTGAGNHSSTFTLNPQYSLLDDPGYVSGSNGNKTPAAAGFVHQYCNGSRVPPEIAPTVCSSSSNAPGCLGGSNGGITVPPGVPDINPFYPLFALNPAATTDEGNNFINMFYGPLTLSNPTIPQASGGYNVPLGNYGLAQGSAAIGGIPPTSPTFPLAPARDFFGQTRAGDGDPSNTGIDMGAVEFRAMRGFRVSTTSLNFTSTFNVRTAPQAVTVVNTGNITLTFTTSGLGGGGAQFAATPTPTATSCTNVAPGANCTFNVTFDPTVVAPNPNTATMNVNAGGGTTAQSVLLTGTLLVPTYSVSQSSLTFNSSLNVRSAGQTVVIMNTSPVSGPSALPLPVNTTNISSNNGQFSLTPACTGSLAPQATCTMTVTFRPTTATPTPKTANLNINVGAGASPATTTVSLTGNVVVPTYTVSPNAMDFGSEFLGTVSPSQSLTITNTSTNGAVLNVTGTPITGPGSNQYGQTPACPNTLLAGASCVINVTFRPGINATPGPQPATLTVNVSSPATLASPGNTVALTGNADSTTGGGGGGTVSVAFSGPVPALNASGDNSTNPKSGTITVTNNSSGALTLSADPTVNKVSGPSTSTFAISTPSSGTQCVSGLTLNIGDQCTIGVTFTHPSSNSNATAHVTLSDTLAGVGGTLTQSSSNFTAN